MLPSVFGENLFDVFFDDFLDDNFMDLPARRGHKSLFGRRARKLMKTDVRETDSTYELDVDLPGFRKNEISLGVKDGYLTISAAKGLDQDEEHKRGRFIRRERYAGACSRSFYVGDVEPDQVSAKFAHGVLKISVPKKVHQDLPGSNTIEIQSYNGSAPGRGASPCLGGSL